MKLSVIIVNYNVRAYLEQCLRTVFTAMEGMDGEVFVVDNQSTDGSVGMVRDNFPEVKLIANRENVGFSRANNQAIREAQGEYVLLLNPDTVVGEDVFRKVVAFMDFHPRCGGLGVKMIDGRGRFLPESKRGLPTPQVAFFKIIGLSRLFPRSRVFGRYHLGHLPENEPAPIEILSGACMFLRRSTLDRVGLLDESFFMYGEDIDLSYRITLAGDENWYFPDARIIHYKGESTKKSSVNYVFVFYNAMAIFAKKHFTKRSAGIFPLLINGSIYLSAAAAIAARFLNRTMLPMLDALAVILVVTLLPLPLADRAFTPVPELLQAIGLVAWAGVFGAYDRPVRPARPLPAMVFLLLLLSILISWNGASWAEVVDMVRSVGLLTLLMLSVRGVLHLLKMPGHGIRRRERERILAVGSEEDGGRALALLWQTHHGLGWSAVVPADDVRRDEQELLRSIRRQRVGEVVFCAKDLRWREIISCMERLGGTHIEMKIAWPGGGMVIGPSSIESLQDLYVLDGHTLATPGARRMKRLLDISLSLVLMPLFPLLLLTARGARQWTRDIPDVLLGKKSWVGYRSSPGHSPSRLPALPPGVFDTTMGVASTPPDPLSVARINAIYAKDYSPWKDLRIILHGLRTGMA